MIIYSLPKFASPFPGYLSLFPFFWFLRICHPFSCVGSAHSFQHLLSFVPPANNSLSCVVNLSFFTGSFHLLLHDENKTKFMNAYLIRLQLVSLLQTSLNTSFLFTLSHKKLGLVKS